MHPLKVAVIGTGYLGSVHARIYHELGEATLVGVVDTDRERAREIGGRYSVPWHDNVAGLMANGRPDAVSIATPTSAHFKIAAELLDEGVACLVEKPITTTLEQAEELCDIARRRGVTLSVGHVERFNPAFLALREHVQDPKFIEAHRLTSFRFRSVDIGVVLDLMIHDLDLILSLVGAEVDDVAAAGVNIVSPHHEDIANCRLTFANGVVANLTASRISETPMRRMRFFTPQCYAAVDLQKREASVYRKTPNFDYIDPAKVDLTQISDPNYFVFNRFIDHQTISIDDEEPLKLELQAFVKAVAERSEPIVTGEHGTHAIKLAFRVLAAIDSHLDKYNGGRQP